MNFTIRRDEVTRKVNLGLSNVPDVDVTETWHKRKRVFRPDSMWLSKAPYGLEIGVSGPALLQNGTPGESRLEMVWYSNWITDTAKDAPDWVKEIVRTVLEVVL